MNAILRNLFLATFFFFACFSKSAVHAHSNNPFGLGVVLGEPSGLSARYWLDSRKAADFSLAYSFDDYIVVTGDLKWNFDNLIKNSGAHLHPYAGVGAAVLIASNGFNGHGGSNFGMALRIPVGIEWMVGSSPIGIFLELVPFVGIVPNTYGDISAGIGARFFF